MRNDITASRDWNIPGTSYQITDEWDLAHAFLREWMGFGCSEVIAILPEAIKAGRVGE